SVLLLRGPRIAGAGWTRTPYRRRRTSRASVTLRASPHPVPVEHAGWWRVRAATVGDHGPRSRRRPRTPGPGTSARARAPQPHLVVLDVPVHGRGAGRRPHGLASGAPGRARRRRFRAGGHRGDRRLARGPDQSPGHRTVERRPDRRLAPHHGVLP